MTQQDVLGGRHRVGAVGTAQLPSSCGGCTVWRSEQGLVVLSEGRRVMAKSLRGNWGNIDSNCSQRLQVWKRQWNQPNFTSGKSIKFQNDGDGGKEEDRPARPCTGAMKGAEAPSEAKQKEAANGSQVLWFSETWAQHTKNEQIYRENIMIQIKCSRRYGQRFPKRYKPRQVLKLEIQLLRLISCYDDP